MFLIRWLGHGAHRGLAHGLLGVDGLRVRRRRHHHPRTLAGDDPGRVEARGRRVRRLAGPRGGGGGHAGLGDDGLGGRRLFVWLPPDVLQVLGPDIAGLVQRTVVLSGMMRVLVYLRERAGLRPVLVRLPGDLLAWAALDEVAVVSGPRVIHIWSNCYHGHSCRGPQRSHHTWLHERLRSTAELVSIRVHNLALGSSRERWHVVVRLGRRFSGLGRAWSLLPRHVGLGEALFARLSLPVVVTHSPAVQDDPAAKLPEHGPGGYDGDLSGAIGEWQYFLMDEIVLLDLVGNDLEERPVLVEQEIRVAISQDPGAFGCEHEKLVPSGWDKKGSTSVFAAAEQLAVSHDLLLARLVRLARHVLILGLVQLVGGVVADGRQRLQRRLGRRGLRRRRGLGWGVAPVPPRQRRILRLRRLRR